MRKKVLILEDMETTRTALKRIVESCDDAIICKCQVVLQI